MRKSPEPSQDVYKANTDQPFELVTSELLGKRGLDVHPPTAHARAYYRGPFVAIFADF